MTATELKHRAIELAVATIHNMLKTCPLHTDHAASIPVGVACDRCHGGPDQQVACWIMYFEQTAGEEARVWYPATAIEFRQWLFRNDAWADVREWANGRTLKEAWATCPRADWMLWILEKLGYADDRTLRLFACWFVRQVWHLLTDPRSRAAVEVAERYARGEATAEALAAASEDARAAARAAAWAAADAASNAAAWAAVDAASNAAFVRFADTAAEASAWASAAWSSAAEAFVWIAARDAARLAQADELRRRIPWPVVEELLRKQTKAVPE
ncbi:MAG: hypothetical protein ABFE07_08335 [Armatimonadia bacterium]